MDTLIDFILQLYTIISLLQFLGFSYRTIERVWIKKRDTFPDRKYKQRKLYHIYDEQRISLL